MYKYVRSPRSMRYLTPPRCDIPLTTKDVPEAELEMREVLVAWVEFGLQPILRLPKVDTGSLVVLRFYEMNNVVTTLMKNPDYYCAAFRIVGQWAEHTVEKTYAKYLLICSQKNNLQPNF
ncbi:hypothetical protein RCJ22_23415 [Vibrio sp. FNV 38]|nr:hypothetical protein [Vibrio sp. FNV 38]